MKPKRINGIWIRTEIVPEVEAFARHEQALLASLEKAYRGQACKPFDPSEPLRALTLFARWYFEDKIKQRTKPATRRDHVKNLRNLADVLCAARDTANKAVRDGLIIDLAEAWIFETNLSLTPKARINIGFRVTPKIEKMLQNLTLLERLADKAASNVPIKRGRRAVFPDNDIIHGLARVFKESTGRRPSRVEGPFARFVRQFLTAIGQGNKLTTNYVVEMIKDSRARIRKEPEVWAISAFN